MNKTLLAFLFLTSMVTTTVVNSNPILNQANTCYTSTEVVKMNEEAGSKLIRSLTYGEISMLKLTLSETGNRVDFEYVDVFPSMNSDEFVFVVIYDKNGCALNGFDVPQKFFMDVFGYKIESEG